MCGERMKVLNSVVSEKNCNTVQSMIAKGFNFYMLIIFFFLKYQEIIGLILFEANSLF